MDDTKLQLRIFHVNQPPIDSKVQVVVCIGPCIVNYHNETKCVSSFLAVKSEVDLELGVDSRNDAGRKKQILEKTRNGI